ncbi:MAG: DEAD/DEAH box helicase [Treponema sp.]|jgi:DNA excision repair protein ERCC-3|nr:DEAD/DEAH box helicase [Treponema sp.]
MVYDPANPLIVQSDRTILLDVHTPKAEDARAAILPFAELEKSPEHIHTYRITPLSLWNAASANFSPSDISTALNTYTRYPLPPGILEGFTDIMDRYGKIRLTAPIPQKDAGAVEGRCGESLFLAIEDEAIRKEIEAARSLAKLLTKVEGGFSLNITERGSVKLELIRLGWPVQDEAPFVPGEALEVKFRSVSASGRPFAPRDYQLDAVKAVLGNGGPGTGFGVVSLPCGAGKTMVGMALMTMLKTNTLILTTNVAAVHQWIEELLDKTELKPEEIAEYSGDCKNVAPVTLATYQIITWRPIKDGEFPHFNLFRQRPWGLIIYDEVHLLPAPVFRVTAELQAVRRLGLTATLVREDGAEDAVFSLVGPKRYDIPWKDLEGKGWIAEALCTEVRLDLPEKLRIPYAVASPREKYRIASENPFKEAAVSQLVENHRTDQILVIGQYISQLEAIARLLKVPLITGKTPNTERERIYKAFKKGEVRIIVVSKVANFAIDLPDASMAIQVSGAFGSRQEEAQRLGRILRPKTPESSGFERSEPPDPAGALQSANASANAPADASGRKEVFSGGYTGTLGNNPKGRNSYFYTLISRSTVEEDFAANRQKFLAEQGYKYSIQHWNFDTVDRAPALPEGEGNP